MAWSPFGVGVARGSWSVAWIKLPSAAREGVEGDADEGPAFLPWLCASREASLCLTGDLEARGDQGTEFCLPGDDKRALPGLDACAGSVLVLFSSEDSMMGWGRESAQPYAVGR